MTPTNYLCGGTGVRPGMPRYALLALSILLLVGILFAAESPSATQWQLPAADAQQWAEHLRQLAPQGWTVSVRGNDIAIQRNAPVRWRRIIANQSANQGAAEPPPRLHEGAYRLTLRFGPKLTIAEYEQLSAANAQTQKQREQLQRGIDDIPHKFDSYLPRNDDEKRRLTAYREALARLPPIALPDLYTPDHSIQLLISDDGWSMLHDRAVAEECEGVRESILRYFGMYDPETAADPHNLIHPETTASEGSSAGGSPGTGVSAVGQ